MHQWCRFRHGTLARSMPGAQCDVSSLASRHAEVRASEMVGRLAPGRGRSPGPARQCLREGQFVPVRRFPRRCTQRGQFHDLAMVSLRLHHRIRPTRWHDSYQGGAARSHPGLPRWSPSRDHARGQCDRDEENASSQNQDECVTRAPGTRGPTRGASLPSSDRLRDRWPLTT